jgi:hypothetical protein
MILSSYWAQTKPNLSLHEDSRGSERNMFFVLDFVIFIELLEIGNKYIFDLGMRKDLENSTPVVIESVLSNFRCKLGVSN